MIYEILFKKAVNGDKESFGKLIYPIKEKLYKVCFVYLRNEDDVLDCIHDSIIKAIKSIKTLKEPQYFNTWMMKIAVNTCKDYIRKNSKVVLVDITKYENNLICEDIQNENSQDIELALEKLSDSERELIVMRYLEDKKLKDIGDEINAPIGTVKSRLNRILIKLRYYMKGEK